MSVIQQLCILLENSCRNQGEWPGGTKDYRNGGPFSPVLSNIYFDKFDKELEERKLNFGDMWMTSNRVMKSVTL